MRKLPSIILFSFLIPWMITPGTTRPEDINGMYLKSSLVINHDTTGLFNLIKVDSFDLTIVQPSAGVQFYKENIVFLSMTKNEEKMLPDYISFGAVEAYYALPSDSVTGKHILFSPWSSFSYPCEAITFSSDLNTMYFTKLSKEDNKEKIYKAKFTSKNKNQAGWFSEINPEDFCTDDATFSHPTLSSDERILIFASDKQGSLGGMDLFITMKEENKWSAPKNLGESINTPGNEFFPFLDSDKNLYFSSDGLGGYGGFDIFTCKFNGEAWNKPLNLSGRINSTDDDIAFTINKIDGKSAFFTRRHKYSKTEMQLFRVTLNREIADRSLSSIPYIFNGEPLPKGGIADIKSGVQDKPVKEDSKKSKPNTEISESVIYRVQLASAITSKGKYQISVNNKIYDTYEYYYKNEYRYTIGEFPSLSQAKELQNICRKSGNPQAFVVAFKNNVRSVDPALFK